MQAYSKDSYRSFLRSLQDRGLAFKSFLEAPTSEPSVYLRHDVDYSLGMALEIAKVNQALGVQGTFFVLLRSPVYNLFSYQALACVQGILDAGQYIGLHYVAPPSNSSIDLSTERLVEEEFGLLRRLVPEAQPVFSWHNPTAGLVANEAGLAVAGLVNVYADAFTRSMPYYSDSNLRHSVVQLGSLACEPGRPVLHLLLHPFNWIAGGHDMATVLSRTWKHIVREREQEMLLNRLYSQWFPEGMPATILDRFSNSILESTGQIG